MKILWSLFLISFAAHSNEVKKSNLMILGGGGEPVGNTTIFDNSMKHLGNYYNSKQWNQSAMTFNGGHSETENIIRQKFSAVEKKGSFTAVNYNAIIDDYTDKIGKSIQPGEQLMVYVYTHGGQKEEGQLSHSISTSGAAITDTTTIAGSHAVSMDKLKVLTEKAKANGVKLAIVDLSCHSGASLSLADENTCVVTSTGPNHLAYASETAFGDQFTKKLQTGKNLEQIFQEAREVSDDNGTPMISTPENAQITKNLYDALTPYLFHANPDGDKLGSYLIATSQADISCMQKREDDFKKINDLITQIEEVNTVRKKVLFWNTIEKTVDLSELRANILSYKESQDKMLNELRSMQTADLNTVEMIEFEGTAQTPMKWSEIIKTDYDKIVLEKQREAASSVNPTESLRSVRWFQALKAKQTQIVSARPELKRAISVAKSFDAEVTNTYSMASRIKTQEKKLYQALYEHHKKESPKQNPCRDFVL